MKRMKKTKRTRTGTTSRRLSGNPTTNKALRLEWYLPRGMWSFSCGADWRAGLERAILAGMPYEYRVTEAADGTFPVELWSSKGEREQLLYKTQGFETRGLAEAWISAAREVPVQVQYDDRPKPRARVTYLKPRRSRVVIISDPNPLPPLASPPALPILEL